MRNIFTTTDTNEPEAEGVAGVDGKSSREPLSWPPGSFTYELWEVKEQGRWCDSVDSLMASGPGSRVENQPPVLPVKKLR